MFERGNSKKELIKNYDFRKRYDVVLACAFEPCEIFQSRRELMEVFEFYEKIGGVIEKIDKRPYLPHKEINLEWDPEMIYSVPNDIVIPNADIVIGYLGINSTAAGIMLASAQIRRIPISYLYHDYNDIEKLKVGTYDLFSKKFSEEDMGFKNEVYDLIESKEEKELLEILELSLRKFYEKEKQESL